MTTNELSIVFYAVAAALAALLLILASAWKDRPECKSDQMSDESFIARDE